MNRFLDDDYDDHDDRDDDDTIEMELTPEQVRVLEEAAASWASDERHDSPQAPPAQAPSPQVPPATRTPAVTASPAAAQTDSSSAASVWPVRPAAGRPTTNSGPAAPIEPPSETSWPIAPSRQLTHGASAAKAASAPYVPPIAKAPEIVITVDIGPVMIRPSVPASSPINARAPFVIEHAPVKLKPVKPAPVAVPPPPRWVNSQLRGALIAGVVAVAAFLSTIAYVAVTKARPAEVPVFVAVPVPQLPRETAPQSAPAVEVVPVRFANPFDKNEVFEFPPGTTETEAHDAVAAALLQRGQDRLTQAEVAQRRTKRAAHDSLRRSTKLARRD